MDNIHVGPVLAIVSAIILLEAYPNQTVQTHSRYKPLKHSLRSPLTFAVDEIIFAVDENYQRTCEL
jgi:hypothetical protein